MLDARNSTDIREVAVEAPRPPDPLERLRRTPLFDTGEGWWRPGMNEHGDATEGRFLVSDQMHAVAALACHDLTSARHAYERLRRSTFHAGKTVAHPDREWKDLLESGRKSFEISRAPILLAETAVDPAAALRHRRTLGASLPVLRKNADTSRHALRTAHKTCLEDEVARVLVENALAPAEGAERREALRGMKCFYDTAAHRWTTEYALKEPVHDLHEGPRLLRELLLIVRMEAVYDRPAARRIHDTLRASEFHDHERELWRTWYNTLGARWWYDSDTQMLAIAAEAALDPPVRPTETGGPPAFLTIS